MKYIKTFEKLNPPSNILNRYKEASIIEVIKNTVDSISFVDDYNISTDCLFVIELALITQEDYIENIYYHLKYGMDQDPSDEMYAVTLFDFTEIYNKLLKKAPETILNYIMEQPELYGKYKKYIDACDLDIPDWIITANKYNL